MAIKRTDLDNLLAAEDLLQFNDLAGVLGGLRSVVGVLNRAKTFTVSEESSPVEWVRLTVRLMNQIGEGPYAVIPIVEDRPPPEPDEEEPV